MIFVNHIKSAAAAKNYFSQHLAPGDYYGRDSQEMKGEWHGLGAELLGLKGEVKQKDYFALCGNINPQTGRQLTPEKKSDRRVLTDFTFDVPKSVSLALEFSGAEGKGDARILEAFRESVRETMAEMETQAMTRVRKGGTNHDRVTGNMIWSEHIHRTARPVKGDVDLQLHCHATVLNATYDTAENRWKAIQLGDIVRDKGRYQAEFHSRLAGKLREMGYGIERDGNSFSLVGIDRATVEKFSRRTQLIEKKAEALGITDAQAKGDLGRKTREKKAPEPKTMSQLRVEWARRLVPDERKAIIDSGKQQETKTLNAVAGMNYAIEHCFERASVCRVNELLKTALIQSVGNASVEEIRSQLNHRELIRKNKLGQEYVTTKAVRQEELLMTAFAREGRGKYKRLGNVIIDPSLSKEQQAAMTKMLSSRDAVTLLESGAGTGKTTTMKSVVNAIEKSGKKVFAFAPSADASRGVQRSEGFKNADTVERLLVDEKLQKQTKGHVVWIDEAGVLSTPDMLRVFELAKKQEFRVVLTGDTKQHRSVKRGDALRILKKDAGLKTATLSEIRRQTNKQYRQAVEAISKGDTLAPDGKTHLQKGLEKLDEIGAIVEVDGDARHQQIAKDYLAAVSERKGKEFKTALVVSPTHAELGKVTGEIRSALKGAGKLGEDDKQITSLRALGLTDAQKTDYANFEPGQIVKLNQNVRNFIRGEKVTVTSVAEDRVHVRKEHGKNATLLLKDAKRFDVFQRREIGLAKGDKVRITQNGFTRKVQGRESRLDNGSIYEIASIKGDDIHFTNGFVVPKDYGFLTHGYATTSHSGQGKTADKTFVALGSESFTAANRELAYVALSRGRESVRVYTNDKAAMFDAVKRSSARMSAGELLDEARRRKPPLMERLFNVQRIRRAYQAVRERMTWGREVQRGYGY